MHKTVGLLHGILASALLCGCMIEDGGNLPSEPGNGESSDGTESDFKPATVLELGVPEEKVDQLLDHSSFWVGYNYESRQAAWVGYALYPELVRIRTPRDGDFFEDPQVPPQYQAKLADYRGSGYQRGHLAPNASLDHTEASMKETFVLSNISPQKTLFNLTDWRQLETHIRDCVKQYQDTQAVFVFTGPYFSDAPKTIGQSDIPVPEGFYKVVYEFNSDKARALGYVAPHASFDFKKLNTYVRSIDEIEALTGLNFGHQIPDAIETELESVASEACAFNS